MSNTINIRQAEEFYLMNRPKRKKRTELYVSDLGNHPWKFMNRVIHQAETDFPINVLDIMEQGSVLEAQVITALQRSHANVMTQFPLHNDIWSGYADIVIGHGTDDVLIADIKHTSNAWFDYKSSLPRAAHICQIWMYGYLYREMFGVTPKLKLYYKAWGQYAELDVIVSETSATATGYIAVKKRGSKSVEPTPVMRTKRIACDLLRQQAESLFNDRAMPDDLMFIDPETWDYAEEVYEHLIATNEEDLPF